MHWEASWPWLEGQRLLAFADLAAPRPPAPHAPSKAAEEDMRLPAKLVH